jgi:TolB protein
MPATGGNPQRVTFAGATTCPDDQPGRHVTMAYVSRLGGGAFKLQVMELSTGGNPR